MREFEYAQPATLDEAVALLRDLGPRAKLLAGGTDLILLMQAGVLSPDYLIDVRQIPELTVLDYDDAAGLTLGAAVTLRRIETSPLLRAKYPHLASSAGEIGSVQVRNLGTAGGNVCNATPSADTAPALITLGARAHIVGPRGERTVPLEEFFTGPRRTVLAPDELLVDLRVPPPAPRSSGAYVKLANRPAMDVAFVGVAATIELAPGGGAIQSAKIALGAVAPTPIRAPKAEELLRGRQPDPELLEAAGRAAAEASRPISDVRASAEYRREMVAVLTRRAVREAWERAAASGDCV